MTHDVTQILVAGSVGLIVSIGLTPVLIRVFSKQGFGQEIRVEGPESHQTKRGTPSMGGVAIVTAIVAAYFSAHIVGYILDDSGPTASGMLVLGLIAEQLRTPRFDPEEFAKLVYAIVDNPMLNGQCIRLDAGQRFAPK